MVNQQLLDYVSAQKSAGMAMEEIGKVLLGVGWKQGDIDEVFKALEPVAAPSPIPAPPIASTPVVEKTSAPLSAGLPHTDQSQAIYGDGSLASVFDVGIPGSNVGNQTNVAAMGSAAGAVPGLVENKWAAPTISPLPEGGRPKIKGLGKWMVVGVVFFVLGIVGGMGWWMFSQSQNKVSPEIEFVSNDLVSPTPELGMEIVESEEDLGTASAILETAPFVSNKGFKINPPLGWKPDESGTFGTLITFSNTTVDEDKGNKFIANINVVTEGVKTTTLDEYLKVSKATMKKTFTSYKEISEEKVEVDGKPAVLLEATYDMGVYTLHNLQMMLIASESAYVVTGASLDSAWENYSGTIAASLMTFSL